MNLEEKNKVYISSFKYDLIYRWMKLNGFIMSSTDKHSFIKKDNETFNIHIVSNDSGDLSFMIIFQENGKKMHSFTGDINLPTLLGYLLWNELLTDYKILKE